MAQPLCLRVVIVPKGQNIHGVDVVRFTADFSTVDLFNWCIAKGETNTNVNPVCATRVETVGGDSKCEDRSSGDSQRPDSFATSHLPSSRCVRVPVSDVGSYRCPIDLRKASDAVPLERWVVNPEDDDWTGVD